MNRNTVIGIVLIVLIFVLFGILNKPSKEEIAKSQHRRDSLEQVIKDSLARVAIQKSVTEKQEIVQKDTTTTTVPDSVVQKLMKEKYGELSAAAKDDTVFYMMENNKVRITFTNKGGRPCKIELKEYKTFQKKPVVLWQGDSTMFGLSFFAQNRNIETQQFYFKALSNDTLLNDTTHAQTLTFRLVAGERRYLDFIYELEPNSYQLKFTIHSKNLNELTGNTIDYMVFDWQVNAPQLERNVSFEKTNTTIYYKYEGDEVNNLSETKDAKEDLRTRVKWIAFKQQFFSSVFLADEPFLNATVETKQFADTASHLLKQMRAEITLSYQPQSEVNKTFRFYFGPNHFNTMKKQGIEDLVKVIPLGWGIFGWINRFIVIPVFNFLNEFIRNYGIIILILTILIKLILFPLTFKSYQATAKMRVLKPQIDELQKKIPKDKPMELQQATMGLYKKAGVNPMGGCLPMLLQLPILFAMFKFFPSSFELRQQSFLWATDLSTYDSIWDFHVNIPVMGDHLSLFCLLMTASTLIYTYQQNKLNPNTSMPSMKYISYLMPIMFLFIFNNYSAGLSYYLFLANVITFIQTDVTRRLINEEKLLAQLNENKKKPVKKSRFQARMEEITRQQQAQMKKKR